MPRHVRLQVIENFRDFGGYASASGRRLKDGLLYRSAHHHRATADDVEALAGIGLEAVVDLRTRSERLSDPSPPLTPAPLLVYNDLDEDDAGWAPFLAGRPPEVEVFRRRKIDWYGRMAFDPRHVDLFARWFGILAQGRGPVLIHCAAGKDRTGILAALTHHLAGVGRDDMVADYLVSNAVGMHEARAPAISRRITAIAARAPTDGEVWSAMAVETAYLDAAFDSMVSRCGSVDAYLERILGVGTQARSAIEAHILA